jgi:hypothetical protein
MRGEGSLPSDRIVGLGDINMPFTEEMHNELMMGYCGSITFLDTQIGRLLDAVDKLNLWHNITIVLTADHGMHNGEKGIWEKWSMFDESTRVPLMIYHPLSPFGGQHYTATVELIDDFPTVIDLLNPPFNRKKVCSSGILCHALQGKSLAPIVLGSVIQRKNVAKKGKTSRRRLRQILEGEGTAEPIETDTVPSELRVGPSIGGSPGEIGTTQPSWSSSSMGSGTGGLTLILQPQPPWLSSSIGSGAGGLTLTLQPQLGFFLGV